jgi:CAAX protease family protein
MEAESYRKQIEIIHRLARALNHHRTDLPGIAESVVAVAGHAIGAVYGCLAMFDENNRINNACILNGDNKQIVGVELWSQLLSTGLASLATSGGHTYVIRDLKSDPRSPVESGLPPALIHGSLVSTVLEGSGVVLGVMMFLHRQTGFFDRDAVTFLEQVADITFIALRNVSLPLSPQFDEPRASMPDQAESSTDKKAPPPLPKQAQRPRTAIYFIREELLKQLETSNGDTQAIFQLGALAGQTFTFSGKLDINQPQTAQWVDQIAFNQQKTESGRPIGKTEASPEEGIQKQRLIIRLIWSMVYLSGFALAEISGILVGKLALILAYTLVLLVTLNYYAISSRGAHRRLLPGLALCALLRLLSLTLGVIQVPGLYLLVIIGIPVLAGEILTIQLVVLPDTLWKPRLRGLWLQLLIALTGIPLSIIGYKFLHPDALITSFNGVQIAIAAVILFIFDGLIEEVLFRGVIQSGAQDLLGKGGVLVSSTLSAVVYLGTLSWQYVLFAWLTGILFGYFVYRTKSLWGAIAAHSIISIGMLVVLPMVVR